MATSRARDELNGLLCEACDKGLVHQLKDVLARGARVDVLFPKGLSGKRWTALGAAAFEGHAECVALMVKAGASVSIVDDEGCTPLYRAAFRQRPDIVKLLLHGTDTAIPTLAGRTVVDLVKSDPYWDAFPALVAQMEAAQGSGEPVATPPRLPARTTDDSLAITGAPAPVEKEKKEDASMRELCFESSCLGGRSWGRDWCF